MEQALLETRAEYGIEAAPVASTAPRWMQDGAEDEVAAALAAELAAANARSDEAEQRMTAQRIEADAAHGELRTALTPAQARAAEAREEAARLAGQLQAHQEQAAALLARINPVEGKAASTRKKGGE